MMELVGYQQLKGMTRVEDNSRGRSGAGRFLSNFEPEVIVSMHTSETLRTCSSYLQALLVAGMDLDASIC